VAGLVPATPFFLRWCLNFRGRRTSPATTARVIRTDEKFRFASMTLLAQPVRVHSAFLKENRRDKPGDFAFWIATAATQSIASGR
jgi:hypothetical protein